MKLNYNVEKRNDNPKQNADRKVMSQSISKSESAVRNILASCHAGFLTYKVQTKVDVIG